jgi:hypothetical protein
MLVYDMLEVVEEPNATSRRINIVGHFAMLTFARVRHLVWLILKAVSGANFYNDH